MKQLLSNDTCRCHGLRCPQRDICLRYTDKPSGERVPYAVSLHTLTDEQCSYILTLEKYNEQ